ncbi:protein kinase [Rheinheimera marina]|uniref:Protein kinase n=1 Tax=Rheinheimera marina TaxID=1774958 RepID=A0ABV9JHZ2_9GAMM
MTLSIRLGQYSTAGCKAVNQDSYGAVLPQGTVLATKGIALAVADGVSSSRVSQVASETAIQSFLQDYYCTNDAWSVPHSCRQVVQACHQWLVSQNRQSGYSLEPEKGYLCTFTSLVLRRDQAYWLHIGDSRMYLLRGRQLEQLTRDHRVWQGQASYLSQALGLDQRLEPEQNSLTLQPGDLLLLATDGLFDALTPADLLRALTDSQLDPTESAHQLAQLALDNGATDNISLQLVVVDAVDRRASKPYQPNDHLPLPPALAVGDELDGFEVTQVVQQNSRSFVYQVYCKQDGRSYLLKAPSTEHSEQPEQLERLLREEWIARRVQSRHLLKAAPSGHSRTALYSLFEFIEGQSLRQWLQDHPKAPLEQVRQLIEQVGRALQSLHRSEILHQDLRPENVMIDHQGLVVVIDYGSAKLAGLDNTMATACEVPGTALYRAPEYMQGEAGNEGSDLYSLAVLTYHLLTGQFPYGTAMARCTTAKAQSRLSYQSARLYRPELPLWLDQTLQKAVQPSPASRYQLLSEFLYDLRQPNPEFMAPVSLIQQHPLAFWQALCVFQLLLILALLIQ